MKLNIQAPINSLSYGIMSCNIIKELIRLKVDLTILPIGRVELVPSIFAEYMPFINKYFDQSNLSDANSLRIYHADDLAQKIGSKQHIGYTAFELDKFTPRQLSHLKLCDKVITCSKWGESILSDNGIEKCGYSPLGVDRYIFNENVQVLPKNLKRKNQNRVFLHVGKAETRKSTLEIVEAFNIAFNKEDDVELWMCIPNIFLDEKERGWWSERILSPQYNKLWAKTQLINQRVESQFEIAQIMIQADVGVFPARAEGFNLPALEMLSCGKHVIATNYSAHTEYLSPANSDLIEIDELEMASDNKWFKTGIGKWAKIGIKQIHDLAGKMKHCYENMAADYVNANGIKTAKQFSWENTAKKILGFFDE